MTVHDRDYLKPLPVQDGLSAPFWAAANKDKLIVQHCKGCDLYQHYPRPHCTHCGSLELEWLPARGHAEVHTFTVTHRNGAPGFVDELPYVFAILELPEGVRMPGNVVDTDPAEVHIGMPVEVCFERATDEIAIPQWRPIQ